MPELRPVSAFRSHSLRVPAAIIVLLSLIVGFLVLTPFTPKTEAASADLFFSEYIEGTSNNKALEIYNDTGSAINLSTAGYSVFMSFNGGSTTLSIPLTGTVAAGDVYVLAQASANATILAQADQTNSSGWYNGDDAIELRKGSAVIDSIGQVGVDPGTEWGTGLTSTSDNTLRRKSNVCAGDTNSTDAFDPSVQWDGFAVDTFSGLGSHSVVCGSPTPDPSPSPDPTPDPTPNPTPGQVGHIVISQVYGGGGNTGAIYRNDYVELFNPDTKAHDLSGWTIQYASASGTSWQVQPLGGTMQPGEYYLIKLGTGGTPGAVVPDANIVGSINMSGSTGKVALSSAGDAFDGCPTGDPALVDLVGYGSSANCNEGSANAPAISVTTADFRKLQGFQDTNVNGSDFTAAAPNPRRTSPIVELPPSVLTSDPRTNAATAPRDANITVTFTEPVTVDDGWINISCVTTGAHNSFTIAPGGANSWIVIPNVNFAPGEQCTVNVVKEFVHDTDTDDATPADDLLTKNFSATFTVATGTAPAYPSEVNLAMGNPSGAVADPYQFPDNYLMVKPEYSMSYNRDKGTPNWVSWHLADEWVGTLNRVDTFRADPAVPADWYRVTAVDYSSSGFDRGHMVPNADRDKETSIPINQATFLMSNMIPQAPDNNQGPWADLENYLRSLLPGNEIYIVSGPAGVGGTGSNGPAITVANGHVTVPASTWKVALVLPKDSGDDLSRVTCSSWTIAVDMPNVQGIRNTDWTEYLTTVDAVEQKTDYDLFSNLPSITQACVEAGTNGVNPPGTADQSVTTSEDTPVAFTLNAANSAADELILSVTSGPSGELSCVSVNCTYTPVGDFNGVDSFSYQVTNSNGTSNTSTVTININAVNDAPTLDPIAAQTVYLGDSSTFTATASDIDEPGNLTFGLTGTVPAGASIDPVSSSFTWTPTADQAGKIYVFGVRVTDSGGLYADQTVTIAVAYPWSGITGKLSAGASSYRLGSTIPVTFSLTGAAAGITDATAYLYLAKVENGVVGEEFAATPSGSSNTGNLFRYDTSAGQYVYNLSTKGLTAGTYQLRLDLGDGVQRTVLVTLN